MRLNELAFDVKTAKRIELVRVFLELDKQRRVTEFFSWFDEEPDTKDSFLSPLPIPLS